MATLVNAKTEIRYLKSITTTKDSALAAHLMSRLNESHFFYTPAQEAFKFLMNYLRTNSSMPAYRDIIADPSITDTTAKILRGDEQEPISTKEEGDSALQVLDKYRKIRGLNSIMDRINEDLNADGGAIDVDESVNAVSDLINETRLNHNTEAMFISNGEKGTARAVVDQILNLDENSDLFIPTGIKSFDEENGGWFRGSVILIGSSSGGGKSMMSNQIAMNQAVSGYKVCIGSFEMPHFENQARVLSNLSQIPINKVVTGKLTKNEKAKVKKVYADWEQKIVDKKGCHDILVPDRGMTVQEFLLTVKHKYDIVYIDYISLLEMNGDDSQWQQLDAAVKYCKQFAMANNIAIAVVVQLDKSGTVKFSKSMLTHASNSWFWTALNDTHDPENITIQIVQEKARNANPAPFSVTANLSVCSIFDPSDPQNPGVNLNKSSDDDSVKHLMS